MILGMNVSLTPQLEKFVERKVKQGTYQTASEVVRAALRMLAENDERRSLERKRLSQEIKLGLDQVAAGDVAELDIKKIKAEGRKALAARRLKRVG
jgi:antitoxin ParD1/3/4